jgi:uncharacterized protein
MALSGSIVQRPQFLDQRDHAWVEALVEECRRFEGQPLRALQQRVKEPFPFHCPQRKLRFVLKALGDLIPKVKLVPKKSMQDFRLQLFPFADRALETCQELGVEERRCVVLAKFKHATWSHAAQRGVAIDELLFADLPSEQCLGRIPENLSLPDVMLAANTYLVKDIIQRCQRLDLFVRGQIRQIVRQASLRGLICVAQPLPATSGFDAKLSLSGPLGLFRHTRLYGRQLKEIIPFLPCCYRFSMHAYVPAHDELRAWRIQSGDPIEAAQIKAFDSKLEQRFSRAFSKFAPDFDLIREPQAILVEGRYIFPDFAIKHRTDARQSWLEVPRNFGHGKYIMG